MIQIQYDSDKTGAEAVSFAIDKALEDLPGQMKDEYGKVAIDHACWKRNDAGTGERKQARCHPSKARRYCYE